MLLIHYHEKASGSVLGHEFKDGLLHLEGDAEKLADEILKNPVFHAAQDECCELAKEVGKAEHALQAAAEKVVKRTPKKAAN